MAITVAAVRDEENTRDPVAALHRRVSLLLGERDRARDRLEQVDAELGKMRATHRHALTIKCDGCAEAISVSSAEPPDSGDLARGLVAYALALRWYFGPKTIEALKALGALRGGDGDRVRFAWSSDRCARCMVAETSKA